MTDNKDNDVVLSLAAGLGYEAENRELRQAAEIASLRAALTKIREVTGTSTEANLIARRALGDEQSAGGKLSRSP
jgi:hypothetical protein